MANAEYYHDHTLNQRLAHFVEEAGEVDDLQSAINRFYVDACAEGVIP